MVRAHTEAEKKALPPPLALLGCSTAAHAINWHKFLTFPVVLSMMYYFDNFTQPALFYLLLCVLDRAGLGFGQMLCVGGGLLDDWTLTRFFTEPNPPPPPFSPPDPPQTNNRHSIYCSCWLTKHMTFRDKSFDEKGKGV